MAALLDKATQQFARGDHKIALATLRRLLQQERRNLNAHLLAGTIHEKQGNLEEAARFFADAVALTSDRKREFGLRAAAHYLSAGAPGKALSALMALQPFMPDDVDVNHGICNLLREAGHNDLALPFAAKLMESGQNFGHFLNAGLVLVATGHHARALPVLKRALALQPGDRLTVSELFWCAANLCDFELADRLQEKLADAWRREGVDMDIRENAFRALLWSGDETYHQLTALRTAAVMFPPVAPERPVADVSGRRIRVGYVSSDFHEHATLSLFAGVLEAHDRDRFEIFAFCHTAESARQGPMRARFAASVDHLVDIAALDDGAAAEAIRHAGIDILVDLKGYTQGNRLGIFCRRPAPVQVSYLGFPGSVSGVGIDYALTDAIVTPPASQDHYEERLLRLPQCYQANDKGRVRPTRPASRGHLGLPEEGVVFAAFHQAPKIRSASFNAWMEILKRVPGSVLWLAPQEQAAAENLQHAAGRAGVDPQRLVFAPLVPMAEHLQRLAAADIALDTVPCNGHTTTSDALWAGVPVVTVRGTSFAGRVSESLLGAVNLPELVTPDLDSFVRLTDELAQDGDRLSALRQHLIAARDTAPLFDTGSLTRAIEAHYEAIAPRGSLA